MRTGELREVESVKVKAVPLVEGALGTIPKALEKTNKQKNKTDILTVLDHHYSGPIWNSNKIPRTTNDI